MKIIHEEGIHSLTLRRVAEGLEISEAALFRHFKDKEEMINLLATKVFDHYIVRESNGYEDVEAGLLKIMINQFSSFQGTPEATSVLFQEEISESTQQSKRASTRGGIRGRTDCQDGQGCKGKHRVAKAVDPDTFALIYMVAMRAAVWKWRSEGCTSDLVSKG